MSEPKIVQVTDRVDVSDNFRQSLIDCWVAVTNAGGAAGFPYPPVAPEDVEPSLSRIVTELHPDRCRLLSAVDDRGLLGWLVIRRDADPLIAHWATLHHVQSHPNCRGAGVGSSLMRGAADLARDELGVEHLHLAARAGVGLERFYGRLGWQEIGRWPAALRLAHGDDRAEILMYLDLATQESSSSIRS